MDKEATKYNKVYNDFVKKKCPKITVVIYQKVAKACKYFAKMGDRRAKECERILKQYD